MGAWGEGIYENDSAAEILIDLYERFEAEASTYLDSERITDVEPDEMAPHVLVYLDLIRILAEGAQRTKEGSFDDMLFVYRVPERSKLERWKDRMIKAHTGWMEDIYASKSERELRDLEGDYNPDVDERLAVIKNLFDRLIDLSGNEPPTQSG